MKCRMKWNIASTSKSLSATPQSSATTARTTKQPTTHLLNATIMEWCICLPVIWQPSNTGYPSKIITGGISPHRWPKGMSQCYYNDECSPCSNQYCMQTLPPRSGVQQCHREQSCKSRRKWFAVVANRIQHQPL